MKFQSYDELITFLAGKHLPTLDFQISDPKPERQNVYTQAGGQDVVNSTPQSTPPQPGSPVTGFQAAESVIPVKFTSFYDNPELLFEAGDESVLLVEEYNSMPNSCSTTSIIVGDREILIGVCEDCGGQAMSKFDIIVDGKSYFGKSFRIETDKTKYKNTIALNAK